MQSWYEQRCDGDWEHQYGIKIETLDNPGWVLTVDLAETDLEGASFDEVIIERSDRDWVRCRREQMTFRGYGGPSNLDEILTVFLRWSEQAKASLP